MSDELTTHSGGRSIGWFLRMDSALNHDFCPWANRWVYWLKNPFWDLVLAVVASAACGVLLNSYAFCLTGILLLITGVGVIFPWLTMRGIDGHVAFDVRRTRVNRPVLVRLQIRNRWPWPVWGLSVVRGFAVRDTADTAEGVSLARVPGWSTVDFSWQFVPVRRGRYPLMLPEVETGFPFGLYRASRATTVEGHLVVWPQTVALAGMPDACETNRADDDLADRRVGDFGDILGTRPFRDGDSLRRVHWAQTARQQMLIVTERQAPAMTSVRVTLDSDPASYRGMSSPGAEDRLFELCVRVAASVCESLHRQHSRVELVTGDQLLAAGEAATGFDRLMDALAQVTLAERPGLRRHRGWSEADGFRIAVTTPAGLSGPSCRWNGQHVITVAVEAERETSGGRLWIRLEGSDAVDRMLPRLWKGACSVR